MRNAGSLQHAGTRVPVQTTCRRKARPQRTRESIIFMRRPRRSILDSLKSFSSLRIDEAAHKHRHPFERAHFDTQAGSGTARDSSALSATPDTSPVFAAGRAHASTQQAHEPEARDPSPGRGPQKLIGDRLEGQRAEDVDCEPAAGVAESNRTRVEADFLLRVHRACGSAERSRKCGVVGMAHGVSYIYQSGHA